MRQKKTRLLRAISQNVASLIVALTTVQSFVVSDPIVYISTKSHWMSQWEVALSSTCLCSESTAGNHTGDGHSL